MIDKGEGVENESLFCPPVFAHRVDVVSEVCVHLEGRRGDRGQPLPPPPPADRHLHAGVAARFQQPEEAGNGLEIKKKKSSSGPIFTMVQWNFDLVKSAGFSYQRTVYSS